MDQSEEEQKFDGDNQAGSIETNQATPSEGTNNEVEEEKSGADDPASIPSSFMNDTLDFGQNLRSRSCTITIKIAMRKLRLHTLPFIILRLAIHVAEPQMISIGPV